MSALDHARGLLLMARKDFDAMHGMIGNPLFADEVKQLMTTAASLAA